MFLTRRHMLTTLAAATAMPVLAKAGVPTAKSLAVPVVDGASALPLKILNEQKEPVSLADWQGRWVVLSLWGPWCKQCKDEMPSVVRMSRALDSDHIQFLPLAFERKGPWFVRKFLTDNGFDELPVYMGNGRNLHDTLGLERLPTTAILTPDLQHAYTITGEAVWDDPETIAWLNGLGR